MCPWAKTVSSDLSSVGTQIQTNIMRFGVGFFSCMNDLIIPQNFVVDSISHLAALQDLYPVLSYMEIHVSLDSSHMSDVAWK